MALTNNFASITAADVYQSGTDNCATVNPVSVTPNTFDCSNVGSNTVTLTVSDGNGNTGTCGAVVVVIGVAETTPVQLKIAQQATNLQFSWPVTCTSDTLEETTTLTNPNGWTPAGAPVTIISNEYRIALPFTGTNRFFRVRRSSNSAS